MLRIFLPATNPAGSAFRNPETVAAVYAIPETNSAKAAFGLAFRAIRAYNGMVP